jgi:hypothetical protein
LFFKSHIRLSSLHNKNILFSFVKEIAVYCVDLRIDNLNWMNVVDLRRLLSNFRSLICFHSGNVSLSKSTLINDIQIHFPFLKYITLLISLDDLSSVHQNFIVDNLFQNVCESLRQMNQLEYISLILQDKKGENRIGSTKIDRKFWNKRTTAFSLTGARTLKCQGKINTNYINTRQKKGFSKISKTHKQKSSSLQFMSEACYLF